MNLVLYKKKTVIDSPQSSPTFLTLSSFRSLTHDSYILFSQLVRNTFYHAPPPLTLNSCNPSTVPTAATTVATEQVVAKKPAVPTGRKLRRAARAARRKPARHYRLLEMNEFVVTNANLAVHTARSIKDELLPSLRDCIKERFGSLDSPLVKAMGQIINHTRLVTKYYR